MSDALKDAIKFANERNWHIDDVKSRRRYLVSCFYTMSNRSELEAMMIEIMEATDEQVMKG